MKDRSSWPALGLLLFATISGCGSSVPPGTFDARGYVNGQYEYRVLAGQGGVLGEHWLLDNFYMRRNRLTPKDADPYQTEFELDVDGDGEGDTTREQPLYDLRYKHKQRDAIIWIRTFPVSQDLREKDLRVLMHRYVDRVAGAGYEAVQIHPNRSGVVERRFAPALLDEGAATLAGADAYEATIDVANVDRHQVDEGRREVRVRLVLVRPGFSMDVRSPSTGAPASFPVLLVAGYANLPDDFESDLPDFQALLNQISIRDRQGYQGPEQQGEPKPPRETTAPPDAGTSPEAGEGGGEHQPVEGPPTPEGSAEETPPAPNAPAFNAEHRDEATPAVDPERDGANL